MKRRYYYNRKRCSKGEYHIAKLLEFNQITFHQEQTFDLCRSPKNYLLRFDFYLPNYKTLIEFQGHHHYHPINKYRKAKYVHQQTVIHDQIKRDFAIQNGFKLIEIHHKYLKNIKDLIIL